MKGDFAEILYGPKNRTFNLFRNFCIIFIWQGVNLPSACPVGKESE